MFLKRSITVNWGNLPVEELEYGPVNLFSGGNGLYISNPQKIMLLRRAGSQGRCLSQERRAADDHADR